MHPIRLEVANPVEPLSFQNVRYIKQRNTVDLDIIESCLKSLRPGADPVQGNSEEEEAGLGDSEDSEPEGDSEEGEL